MFVDIYVGHILKVDVNFPVESILPNPVQVVNGSQESFKSKTN